MYTAAGCMAFFGLLVMFCNSIETGTKIKNPFAAIIQVIWCGWIVYCMILLIGILRLLNGQISELSGTGF